MKHWTEEDNERLKALIAQGASATRAAAIFNCKIHSIRVRAKQLGLSFPTVREARKKLAASAPIP